MADNLDQKQGSPEPSWRAKGLRWSPGNVPLLLASQPRRALTERDEFMNMIFGADNDGEWLSQEEWDGLYGGSDLSGEWVECTMGDPHFDAPHFDAEEVKRLATRIYNALRTLNPGAVVQGDPVRSGTTLIDGDFDLTKIAAALLA